MAIIDKSYKPRSARAHNGHSTASKTREPLEAGEAVVTRLAGLGRLGRELPRRLEALLKNNPAAFIAGVGASAFVLGAFMGSRLGRLALAAAIPYAVERVFEGAVGEKIGEYARSFAESETSGREAD